MIPRARPGEVLEAARRGDEEAFRRLVEPHRAELHAHCYRMLGSLHDAEDALQDALLRAWRGLGGLRGRGALRSWLYTIATNTCLDAIAQRPKRVLPIDYGPSDPDAADSGPLPESTWIEPYPNEGSGWRTATPRPRLASSGARRSSSPSSPRSRTCRPGSGPC